MVDKLDGWQLICITLIPIVLMAGMFIAVVAALRKDVLNLFQSDHGKFVMRFFVVTFVLLITGSLTLFGKIPESAATALFGSILGYVFGGAGGGPHRSSISPGRADAGGKGQPPDRPTSPNPPN